MHMAEALSVAGNMDALRLQSLLYGLHHLMQEWAKRRLLVQVERRQALGVPAQRNETLPGRQQRRAVQVKCPAPINEQDSAWWKRIACQRAADQAVFQWCYRFTTPSVAVSPSTFCSST